VLVIIYINEKPESDQTTPAFFNWVVDYVVFLFTQQPYDKVNDNCEYSADYQAGYNWEEPPITETWGQGLMVLHNPNALHPIPRDYFPDAAESYLEAGVVKTDLPPFYPYMSQTLCVAFNLDVQPPIESITKNEYYSFKPFKNPAVDLYSRDKEWYADKDRIILGAVLLDTVDNDWVYIILGRDEKGVFRWIEGEVSIEDRDKARDNLVRKMTSILLTGQKVFPQ
jgi:hypothetical protein